jgi:cellulose synthase/poly-beta-1,6-N-acetylglucosamine synthase-like glycosyltransferase
MAWNSGRRALAGIVRWRFLAPVLAFAFVWLGIFELVSLPAIAYGLLILVFLLLTVIGATTVVWMLYAWRNDASLEKTGFRGTGGDPKYSFSLILPARHEQAVLPATIARLADQRHPEFEVIVVVGHDDPETECVARTAIAGDPRFRVAIDEHTEKNKPKALNTGLRLCRGEIIGVFDAEDQVAADLLPAIDQVFQESDDTAVVQGATQLMNFRSSWWAIRNVLEYYFWFRSRLHFNAAAGFIPLGGNTVFVRRHWLEFVRGWDERCLTEDCDLGVRLSALGAKTVVVYGSQLATQEETPTTIGSLLRQRVRWSQGFLQVLRKGDWRRMPRRTRPLAVYTLSFPFLQAAMALITPAALAAVALLKLPILLTLLAFLPLVPLCCMLVCEIIGLGDFGREFGLQPRVRDYIRLIVGFIPYHFLVAVAALRAVLRELRGINSWEKTAHVGAHL